MMHLSRLFRTMELKRDCFSRLLTAANICSLWSVSFPLKKGNRLFELLFADQTQEKYFCNNDLLHDSIKSGQKIKCSIRPEDISLSLGFLEGISIQNQLQGKIEGIRKNESFYYVTVDCGAILTVRVTEAAVTTLGLTTGKNIYCLFKANAIEVVHIY